MVRGVCQLRASRQLQLTTVSIADQDELPNGPPGNRLVSSVGGIPQLRYWYPAGWSVLWWTVWHDVLVGVERKCASRIRLLVDLPIDVLGKSATRNLRPRVIYLLTAL
jgi:hypothetical protein